MRPARRRRRRWLVAALALVAVAAVLVVVQNSHGRSEQPAATRPRPLTAGEADLLAVMRFRNYRGLHFRTVTADGVSMAGDLDFHSHLGYAMAANNGTPSPVQWNAHTLVQWAWPAGGRPAGAAPADPPAQLPTTAHRSRPLDPSRTNLDALLTILLALGQDRPDNAALLRQDGATYLRADSVAGTPVTVMQGPHASGVTGAGSAVTYWVDAAGQLRRVEIALGRDASPVRVDTDPSAYRPFQQSHFVVS